jgi:hypothetical protein
MICAGKSLGKRAVIDVDAIPFIDVDDSQTSSSKVQKLANVKIEEME